MLDFLEKNKDITKFSNFKTKAESKFYFEITDEKDLSNLKEIIVFAKDNKLKTFFIGGGTNLLFAFDIFNGIIIKNNLLGWTYDKETKILESYSNENISNIAETLENSFGQNLWHRFIGLPGSIGGAVYGNAGCFGLEIENNFLQAEVVDTNSGQLSTMSKIDINFSYRNSFLKQNQGRYFLIKASFDLSKKVEKYKSDVDNIDFRENKQPKGLNAGSFFKNPNSKQPAGYLIEQAGLKGYRIGGAYFSEKHANFLMNDGNATYKDLLELIDLAKAKVKEKFGIDLVNEVKIVYQG